MPLTIAAVIFLGLGAALEIWAGLTLGWRRALDLTDVPPDPLLPKLVYRGPFGFVRHPQSLGLLLILAGAALGFQSVGMWVVAVIAGGLVVVMAMRHDRELAAECGEAYVRYQRAVPMLVPRLPRWA
jgi:protein-S-isoprenylcysteine O-methyltransferase Ste14